MDFKRHRNEGFAGNAVCCSIVFCFRSALLLFARVIAIDPCLAVLLRPYWLNSRRLACAPMQFLKNKMTRIGGATPKFLGGPNLWPTTDVIQAIY